MPLVGDKKANLILVFIIVFLFVQLPMAYSSELTVPEKTIAFLEDEVMLDMTKYNATLRIFDVRYPDELHGLAQHNVAYMLLSDEGTLEAAFGFKNESFACYFVFSLFSSFVFSFRIFVIPFFIVMVAFGSNPINENSASFLGPSIDSSMYAFVYFL